MSGDLLFSYPPLIIGTLVRRYKRFFADIQLASGEVITAHCPNTGPMTGVCTVGSLVGVSRSDNPKRKLAYTWEMIQINDIWVGINTGLPNKVIKLALEQGKIPELRGNYSQIRAEVPYGRENKSRIDVLLVDADLPVRIYLEIKNTTLAENNIALFPDTTTTRGQKHLRELMDLLPDARPIMLYFINREDCLYFSPGDAYDPTYGQLLREAVEKGVQVLPCRFAISTQGIRYLGLAEMILPEQFLYN
jgi:sugar fermentation stimulation protein A